MTQQSEKTNFWLTASKAQARDTGMAFTLICLLVLLFTHRQEALLAAIAILVMTMIWPTFFKPAAKLWFGLSHLLGTVMSKILLSVVFLLVVTPVGLARSLFGADAMQKRKWKKSTDSVFRVRDHTFTANDIEQPY
ncbi:SxtJ family membrane protein [Desulfovibrio inopinatus]|uniref:SxtJ family membrane protein n=1 Tax=Desulfovibrio inopinatus TaxID=102109 RepID=UPI00041E8186|nr:SxtJ family membrane protein [Desulfovibrio inopinatus]